MAGRFKALKQFIFGNEDERNPRQQSAPRDADVNYEYTDIGASLASGDSGFMSGTPKSREERYELYDDMDRGIVSSALDMYAEDATQYSLSDNATFWVESDSQEIEDLLNGFLKNTLNIEDTAFPIARSIAKYGEEFDSLVYQPTGIVGWNPAGLMYKRQDKFGELMGYSYESENSDKYSLPWDFIHFKMISRSRGDRKYGTSLLRPLIDVQERLTMMEDAVTLYRMLKMPDRDLHYVDCSRLSAAEASRRLKRRKSVMNKQKFVDSDREGMKKKWTPMSKAVSDLFVPTYEGRDDRVETKSSSSKIQDVYDIEYFRRLWCATARIPPQAIGFNFSGGINFDSGKSLLQQDVMYSRKVKRIQRAELQGIRHVCMLELVFKGLNPYADYNSFTVHGSPISFLDEQQRQDLYKSKLDVVDSFSRLSRDLNLGGKAWTQYLLTNFGGLSTDIVDKIFQESKKVGLSDTDKKQIDEAVEDDGGLREAIVEASDYITDVWRDIHSSGSGGYRFKFDMKPLNKWISDVNKIMEDMEEAKESKNSEYYDLNEKLDRYYEGDCSEIFTEEM